MIIVKTPTSPRTGEKPFQILYNLPENTTTVICIGGRGGMKTYEVSKFIAYSATVKKKRCVILRDEKSKIKQSILNEILLRYDTANRTGKLELEYQKQDNGIKDRSTSQDVVFTMGFRMSSNENQAGLKSVSDIDIAVIEEAEDIRDKRKFDKFNDGIRKEGYLTIIILNTPDLNHWILNRYFNTEMVEDGYFKVIPKDIPGFVCIQTSYLDNQYLPKTKVEDYENYGKEGSYNYDKHHYLTDILGYASSGRMGQVFTKVKPIKLSDYLKIPVKEIYGLDFGTASPAGIVGVKIESDNLYARELNYLPMDILRIGKFFCGLNLNNEDIIIADSANTTDIQLLRCGWEAENLSKEDIENYPQLLKGWNVFGVAKYPGSLESGISLLKGLNIFIVEESKNFWKEVNNYVYGQDKNGNYINAPIDDFNHLWDPTRYVKQSQGRYF